MATCVFTCSNWFCISTITCLIIFSGSSALSIRSLRFARTKVETRSSHAIKYLVILVVGGSSCGVRLYFPDAADKRDCNVGQDSSSYPEAHMADDGATVSDKSATESYGESE